MAKEKFTEKTNIEDILKFPRGEEILQKYQVPCLHCAMAQYEMQSLKIGEVGKVYGINIKALLKELNKLAVNKKIKITKSTKTKSKK